MYGSVCESTVDKHMRVKSELILTMLMNCSRNQPLRSLSKYGLISLHSLFITWYALFARDFTKALTAADSAHALLPDDLSIETNRAHALMFLERGEDCKALYLAYKGKPMSEQDARLWEHVIVKDFAEFRKAGLTHPMMADIEKELGVSP